MNIAQCVASGTVSIPKRVLEALKLAAAASVLDLVKVSIPKRVLEALKQKGAFSMLSKERCFNP